MIYKIEKDDCLCIINDSGMRIFVITKNNDWAKADFDHKGNILGYEDHRG